jgi:Flp pilus assembly pilin Flp
MRISIGQMLLLVIISFLLFGDFNSFKKTLTNLLTQINKFVNNKNDTNRKKGI